MRRRDVLEAAIFFAEFWTTVAYALELHRRKRSYEPDWTWLTVMIGVIISTTPAMALGRLVPADWRTYERWVVAGFLTSGAVIIPWQLWLKAGKDGEDRGYQWSHEDDPRPPLELPHRRAARRS